MDKPVMDNFSVFLIKNNDILTMDQFVYFCKLWISALWINFQNFEIMDKHVMDKILKFYP